MSRHYINLQAQAEKLRRHNRQGSYKTRERYFEAYKRFLRFVGEVYHLEKLTNISGKHLSAYIEQMRLKGYSASTVKTDLAAIRFWHDRISDAKYTLPSNGEFDLARRKFGGVDRAWSNAEFNRMLGECWKAEREDFEACIVIARYAGLRLHEVMRIDTAIARAALRNGVLTIKGKGGKLREVPIQETIRIELEKFLKITPAGHKLFVQQGKQTHIAKTELQNFIHSRRKFVQAPGSARPLTFHGLRHTYAQEQYQRFIEAGHSAEQARRELSQLLGHEREDVTRIYLAGQKGGDADV
ncbi:MAG: tyrosine-type recombinase/integrase [Oscillospiraceae bacterium]|jgi:integrase|nr:tyrosine-type recombinase/integrase [Oscillospiraceae bacterium]